jgi:hypothetical protein
MGGVLLCFLLVLIMFGYFSLFGCYALSFGTCTVLLNLYAGAGALLFSWYLIYDTQVCFDLFGITIQMRNLDHNGREKIRNQSR